MKLGALDPVSLVFTGRSFVIFKINDISTQFVGVIEDPITKVEVKAEMVYEQNFEKCSFVELNRLIKNCKRIFGNKNFDDLLEEVRNLVEFQDLLESM